MQKPWAGPQTEAEASGFTRTSTSAQVADFIAACAAHAPWLAPVAIGASTQQKPLTLVLAADPPVRTLDEARSDPRLKVLVMGNIHAGEVEGKEALMVFLREIAQGIHAPLIRKLVIALLPNYNPDGNDSIDRRNRADQAGPVEGVGVRHNGAGLDLNRDYVKVEAPETEALIRTVRALDACLVTDLHTTNGSFHGFDLTYSGPLHPATDPAILAFERTVFLPALRVHMREKGFETFDYGNWVDEKRPEAGWETFEGRPRFGNSYFGLRNRLTLLSEAYSHDPFEHRIRATHALVVASLGLVATHEHDVRRLVANADRAATGLAGARSSLPTGSKLALTEASRPIPVGSVREEKDPVTGLVRQWDTGLSTPVPMPVFAWFDGIRERPVPAGWIVRAPSDALLRVLSIHGIESTVLDREREAEVERCVLESVIRSPAPFQRHHLKTFAGRCERGTETVPKGALFVPAAQALCRLSFVLLEAESDDGLGTWDLLGADPAGPGPGQFEALRLVSWLPSPR